MDVRQILGGRYQLLSELGTGGMAVVWRAQDEVLGRPVAVKLLAGRFVDDPQSRSRIRHEARAAATLSHPHIAQVYDYGESIENGTPVPYVVMELVNGPTLEQRVADGPLPARTVFRICGEVAAGLAAAHADGLVHRDIKMANIMVTAAGAKVVDFGIAAAAGPAEPGEKLIGTPAYLAPERLAGAEVQPASDVYALGVLLFRLLAGQSPWSVESTIQMLEAHVYLEPDRLPARPGVPPAVTDLVARCLRKDPATRPSAATVSATLADAAEAYHPDRVRGEDGASPVGVPRPTAGHRPSADPALVDDAVTSDVAAVGATGPAVPAPRPASATESVGHPVESPADSAVFHPVEWPADSAVGHPGSRRSDTAGPARSDAVVAAVDPVRPKKRKRLLAGAAAVALIVAGLVGWFSSGDADAPARGQAAVLPSSVVTPARSGAPATPRVSARAGARVPATRGPARPADASGKPAPSQSRAGSTGPAAVPTSPAGARTSEPPVRPSTSPPVAPPPSGTRLTTPGGSVIADCAAGGATLRGWEPAPGFEVEDVDPGPSLAAEIIFVDGIERYRMTVTCVAGVPTPVVLPL